MLQQMVHWWGKLTKRTSWTLTLWNWLNFYRHFWWIAFLSDCIFGMYKLYKLFKSNTCKIRMRITYLWKMLMIENDSDMDFDKMCQHNNSCVRRQIRKANGSFLSFNSCGHDLHERTIEDKTYQFLDRFIIRFD